VVDRVEFFRSILERYGAEEMERVRGMIGSITLRDALELIVDAEEGKAELFIPHYWAEYYHDGRGSIWPGLRVKHLVYFNDPKDDPRIAGGYPVRMRDIVRLTKKQWEDGLAINAERRRAGDLPYMIVIPTKNKDHVGPQEGTHFFDELAEGADERLTLMAGEEFDQSINNWFRTDPLFKDESDTAEFIL
jgi:hypothetical protein